MAAYDDVMGLCRKKDVKWTDYRIENEGTGFISKKEEVTSFFDIGTWENLTVPLHISVKRQTDYVKGKVAYFVLAHSKRYKYPGQAFDLYKVRTAIEERHRQLKCFWDLTKFSSPSYSLVVTQIVFKLICYSLMQLYLYRSDMGSLVQNCHHWSPLVVAATFVRTKRDIKLAIYDLPKDRHVFPWIEVNARFGIISLKE